MFALIFICHMHITSVWALKFHLSELDLESRLLYQANESRQNITSLVEPKEYWWSIDGNQIFTLLWIKINQPQSLIEVDIAPFQFVETSIVFEEQLGYTLILNILYNPYFNVYSLLLLHMVVSFPFYNMFPIIYSSIFIILFPKWRFQRIIHCCFVHEKQLFSPSLNK